MRPGEPTRSTLPEWVRTCEACGASAPDLAALGPEARGVVASEAYRAADRFRALEHALPARAEGRGAAARRLGGRRRPRPRRDGPPPRRRRRLGEPADTQGALRLLDVLRRSGDFAAAAARAARIPLDDDLAPEIVAFQRARIEARDTGRHLLSSALRPPARMPHVAHGRRPKGFWSRLLK